MLPTAPCCDCCGSGHWRVSCCREGTWTALENDMHEDLQSPIVLLHCSRCRHCQPLETVELAAYGTGP